MGKRYSKCIEEESLEHRRMSKLVPDRGGLELNCLPVGLSFLLLRIVLIIRQIHPNLVWFALYVPNLE